MQIRQMLYMNDWIWDKDIIGSVRSMCETGGSERIWEVVTFFWARDGGLGWKWLWRWRERERTDMNGIQDVALLGLGDLAIGNKEDSFLM